MTRRKVKLAYILNQSRRRATYNKRRKGLLKKIEEITTLCGVEGCAIIYGQEDAEPEIWPPSASEVNAVLSRFRALPELEQSRKMLNQETFLKERIQKGKDQLTRIGNDNRKKELTHLMFQCLNAGQIVNNVAVTDINGLSWIIDQNLKQIERRLEETQAAAVVGNHAGNVIGSEQMQASALAGSSAGNMIGWEQMRAAAVVANRAENVIGREQMQVAAVDANRAENMIGWEQMQAAAMVANRGENVIGRQGMQVAVVDENRAAGNMIGWGQMQAAAVVANRAENTSAVVGNHAENVIGRGQMQVASGVGNSSGNVIGWEQMQAGAVVANRAENVAAMVGHHAENVIGREQMQVEAAAGNRAENVTGMDQGMENNVDAMETQPWTLDFMSNNNFGDVLPFGNGNNAPNNFWH